MSAFCCAWCLFLLVNLLCMRASVPHCGLGCLFLYRAEQGGPRVPRKSVFFVSGFSYLAWGGWEENKTGGLRSDDVHSRQRVLLLFSG